MVAVWLLLTVTLLGVGLSTGVAKVDITFTPANLTFTPDQADRERGHVTVTCRFVIEDGQVVEHILRHLVINRTLHGTTVNSTIAGANVGINGGNAELLSKIPGATVSGNLRNGVIALNLNRVTCHDGAHYDCAAHYETVPKSFPKPLIVRISESQRSQEILTVHVTPGPLRLTTSPIKNITQTVEEVLTMTCGGPLGTVQPEQRVEWVWEYRQNFSEKDSWSPLNGSSSDVESDAVTDASRNACYKQGRSVLTRRLTLSDSDRWYRCYVKIDGIPFQKFAAKHLVQAVVDNSAGGTEGPEAHPPLSLLLGLGVGALLVTTAAGVGFALWKRRRLLLFRAAEQTANCPLLPTHRDPEYYGEYLEPIVRVPHEEGTNSGISTEIPNIYEDIDITTNAVNRNSSAAMP